MAKDSETGQQRMEHVNQRIRQIGVEIQNEEMHANVQPAIWWKGSTVNEWQGKVFMYSMIYFYPLFHTRCYRRNIFIAHFPNFIRNLKFLKFSKNRRDTGW